MYCEKDVKLLNTKLNFYGNNSIIYLSQNIHNYILNVGIYNNSLLYIGKNNYINSTLNIILSEGKNVVIGNDCLFSFGIFIRLADPHIIYDNETKKRINPSKSVYVGDHVWVGQDVLILKNTKIGSGSIIAAKAVVSGKSIPSNCIYGGNPLKLINENIFFDKTCVHDFTSQQTKAYSNFKNDEFIYSYDDKEKLNFSDIEKYINKIKDPNEKLEYIKNTMEKSNKNRFFIKKPQKKSILKHTLKKIIKK